MELSDVYARLKQVGRKSAKPSALPRSADPVDRFKIQLEKQIENADIYAKNGFPDKNSGTRWISKTGDTYSVKFGNPAIAVDDAGNRFFAAKDLKDAKELLEFGRQLLNDPTFQQKVRENKRTKRGKAAEVSDGLKPRRGRRKKAQ